MNRSGLLDSSSDIQNDYLICFHSKLSWREACLGLGLRMDRLKGGKIKNVYTGLDIISWTAFNSGVRSGILSTDEKWTHWIPLWINPEHGTRSLEIFKRVLIKIYGRKNEGFKPEWGFDLVQKLMNHFIVMIMKGDIYASERALEGYCHFHRWLQVFASIYPKVLEAKIRVVGDFIENPEKRHKNFVPDLGEFVTIMSLDIKYNWEDIQEAYLSECFARNSLWVIRSHPHLKCTFEDGSIDRLRPELTFQSNRVSLRLCLFHVYFLKHVGRPAGMSGEEVARRYDDRLGRPSRTMRYEWQSSCQDIMKISSFNEYFEAINLPSKSRSELCDFLRNAIKTSPYIEQRSKKPSKKFVPRGDRDRDRNHYRNGKPESKSRDRNYYRDAEKKKSFSTTNNKNK